MGMGGKIALRVSRHPCVFLMPSKQWMSVRSDSGGFGRFSTKHVHLIFFIGPRISLLIRYLEAEYDGPQKVSQRNL